MISVYDANTTIFTNNGLVVLGECMSCDVTEELNGLYECTLEHPFDLGGKWCHLLEGNLIKADGQVFRIYKKNKNFNSIKVTARHIFYDLLDNFLEDVRPENQTGAGALSWILSHTAYAHNFVSSGDVGGLNTHYYVRKNVLEAIMGKEGVIEIWGGELIRDNFNIALMTERGLNRGVLITYKKNIEGIEEDLDLDGIVTRIMPVGKEGLLLPEKYVDSQYILNFPHPKIKTVDFNDIGVIEATELEPGIDEAAAIILLRDAAAAYFLSTKCDIPVSNFKVDLIEISHTDQYKSFAVLERVFLGDLITIRHQRLGIDLLDKVIKITKDVLTDRIIKVESGFFKDNLATTISSAVQEVKDQVVLMESTNQLAINHATDLITGAEGGNVVIAVDAAGKPIEILIMDTEDMGTCLSCWRWNIGGFGFSSTGVAGPFETAMGMDGTIVGKFISALSITTDQVNAEFGSNLVLTANATITDLQGQVMDNASAISLTPENIELAITQVRADATGAVNGLAELKTYYNFTVDGLIMGKEGSESDNFKVRITNQRLDFLDNGIPVAYITDQEMLISQARILKSIVVGNHMIETYNADITILKWVGGEL